MSGRFLLIGPVLMMFVAGCVDYEDGYYRYGANEIVFGIRQRIDPASGESSVTASYEFLGLADKGGWATSVFRDGDGDGTCYFERYDNRLGQPHVESGVAVWTGAKLPGAGLQVLANQREPSKLEAEGWGPDDTLSFDVSGFAMPRMQTVTMNAPRTDLAITMPVWGTTVCARPTAVDAELLCEALRTQYDVTVVPGRFFELPDHIRIGLCVAPDVMNEGLGITRILSPFRSAAELITLVRVYTLRSVTSQ